MNDVAKYNPEGKKAQVGPRVGVRSGKFSFHVLQRGSDRKTKSSRPDPNCGCRLLTGFLAGDNRHAGYAIALFQLDAFDAYGCPGLWVADTFCMELCQFSLSRDKHDVGVILNVAGVHNGTVLLPYFDIDHTGASSALTGVFFDIGSPAESVFGYREELFRSLEYGHCHDSILARYADPNDAPGCAAHLSHILLRKPDRLVHRRRSV
jgi:hypothetical protein